MRSRGAANRHSSTQGQRGERKERSMAAEGQPEVGEKQTQGANAETENIKKPGLKQVFSGFWRRNMGIAMQPNSCFFTTVRMGISSL